MSGYEVPDVLKEGDNDSEGVGFVMPDALKRFHR